MEVLHLLERLGEGEYVMKNRYELEAIAKQIRVDIATMTYKSGIKGAHLGGSMSLAEVLAVLYGSVLRYDVNNPEWNERDRLIISKAHAAVGLYAALKYVGFISNEEMEQAMHGDSMFYEHPKKSIKHGIEFSGGSLGQGLSLGMGLALALKKKGNNASNVFVIVGDGECDEGQIWEAASAIVHFGLNNLTVIVDANGLQYDGANSEIMRLGDFGSRWSSIGYETVEIDGHDVLALQEELLKPHECPKAIIAKTVKGKGVSFAENVVGWHTGRLTEELYRQALEELS